MYRIFDAHAHIYPQKIARKASENIGRFYGITLEFDGTPEALLSLGDKNGVEKFLVHSVATSAAQVSRINDFIIEECKKRPDRFIGFCTLHPDFKEPAQELARVKQSGLMGVKLHPDFQDFEISASKMDDTYAAIAEAGLPVVFHMGDARYTRSHPAHIPVILRRHPRLKVICAHFGAYSQWEEASECLKNENVWVDSSSTMAFVSKEAARRYISVYGEDRVLFGSDYPAWDVGDEIQNLLSLGLSEKTNQKIFSENLSALLELA